MKKAYLAVANYTVKDLLMSKFLYITLFLSLFMFVVTYVSTKFTYGVPAKVAIDVGFGLISISSTILAITLGSLLLPAEMASRTLYLILSRGTTRASFLFGKVLGVLCILAVNFLILVASLLFTVKILNAAITEIFWQTLFFLFIEVSIVTLIAVMFSLLTTRTLAITFTFIIWLLGHTVPSVLTTPFVKSLPFAEVALQSYLKIFPNFAIFNLKDLLLYEETITFSYFLKTSMHGVFYLLLAMVISIMLFRKKELN